MKHWSRCDESRPLNPIRLTSKKPCCPLNGWRLKFLSSQVRRCCVVSLSASPKGFTIHHQHQKYTFVVCLTNLISWDWTKAKQENKTKQNKRKQIQQTNEKCLNTWNKVFLMVEDRSEKDRRLAGGSSLRDFKTKPPRPSSRRLSRSAAGSRSPAPPATTWWPEMTSLFNEVIEERILFGRNLEAIPNGALVRTP